LPIGCPWSKTTLGEIAGRRLVRAALPNSQLLESRLYHLSLLCAKRRIDGLDLGDTGNCMLPIQLSYLDPQQKVINLKIEPCEPRRAGVPAIGPL
jgi:hypothetical protein